MRSCIGTPSGLKPFAIEKTKSMEPLYIAFFLMACAVGLILLELVIPSGGVISAMALLFVVAAVITAFFDGARTGLLFIVGTVLVSGIGLYLFLKVWPRTPMGQKIVMRPASVNEIIDPEPKERLARLVGQVGRAKTPMLPSGVIVIGDETYDALSEGLPIEPNDKVEVVSVRMNRLVVRHVDSDSPRKDKSDRHTVDDDVLSQPIDALGLDPIDDPLQ